MGTKMIQSTAPRPPLTYSRMPLSGCATRRRPRDKRNLARRSFSKVTFLDQSHV
jgi:hypothetical protein